MMFAGRELLDRSLRRTEVLNRALCAGLDGATCQLGCGAAASNCSSGWRIRSGRETRMLWTVFAILLLLWLLGWGFYVSGSLIHLILVIALVVLVIELITGRRATV